MCVAGLALRNGKSCKIHQPKHFSVSLPSKEVVGLAIVAIATKIAFLKFTWKVSS